MKLKSLILKQNRHEIAEVELEFIPGIPQIHFLGLPDRLIKESFYRIKSALKNAGYKFPVSSQIIVNIQPQHLQKSSRGVELAIAIGILLKTEQIPAELIDLNWIIYGELGLDGKVYEPSDLCSELFRFSHLNFLTGASISNDHLYSNTRYLKNLNQIDFYSAHNSYSENNKWNFKRPNLDTRIQFSEEEAELVFLAAISEEHVLVAGECGAGKSTLIKSMLGFLKEPSEKYLHRLVNQWKPMIQPHPSVTLAAFLGGGASLREGEIERAEGGVLFLDELLEFDPQILESLRSPMTGEVLRLARGSGYREIQACFQVLATSNLCPCGKWTPQNQNLSCRFSRQRCTRYLERFSGPLLDRFCLLFFMERTKSRPINAEVILQRIANYLQAVQVLQIDDCEVNPLIQKHYDYLSSRRKKYLDKISNIYAIEREFNLCKANSNLDEDISLENDTSLVIETPKRMIFRQFSDYQKAEKWVIQPFVQLEKGMG